jgi:hypothetical protein
MIISKMTKRLLLELLEPLSNKALIAQPIVVAPQTNTSRMIT